MADLEVMVVPTGTANVASVLAGLRRVGARPRLSDDRREVERAERVVLPGVGTMAAAMEQLRRGELVEILRERLQAGRPTLAVCLGLQLLCRGSEESPDVEGLGVVESVVARFSPAQVRVPQLGWNRIVPQKGCRLLQEGYAYFANSYRLQQAPAGWSVAWAQYDGPFVAAMERQGVLACQFHPELSGGFGLELLARWLEGAPAAEEGEPC